MSSSSWVTRPSWCTGSGAWPSAATAVVAAAAMAGVTGTTAAAVGVVPGAATTAAAAAAAAAAADVVPAEGTAITAATVAAGLGKVTSCWPHTASLGRLDTTGRSCRSCSTLSTHTRMVTPGQDVRLTCDTDWQMARIASRICDPCTQLLRARISTPGCCVGVCCV